MLNETEIREKLAFLEGQLANGNDTDAEREINRLKWVLGEGPDYIQVPEPKYGKAKSNEADKQELSEEFLNRWYHYTAGPAQGVIVIRQLINALRAKRQESMKQYEAVMALEPAASNFRTAITFLKRREKRIAELEQRLLAARQELANTSIKLGDEKIIRNRLLTYFIGYPSCEADEKEYEDGYRASCEDFASSAIKGFETQRKRIAELEVLLEKQQKAHQEWMAAGMKAGFVFSVGPAAYGVEHNPTLATEIAKCDDLNTSEARFGTYDGARERIAELEQRLAVMQESQIAMTESNQENFQRAQKLEQQLSSRAYYLCDEPECNVCDEKRRDRERITKLEKLLTVVLDRYPSHQIALDIRAELTAQKKGT